MTTTIGRSSEAQFQAPAITIRPVRDTDCEFIYFISMDSTVRTASTRSDFFGSEQHEEWWHYRFHDPNTKIWVLEVNGHAVGQIRYGRDGDEAEVAISIHHSYRNMGYARVLLQATMPWAKDHLGVPKLVALVLRQNYSSRRLFRSAGFRYAGVERRMEKAHARYEHVR